MTAEEITAAKNSTVLAFQAVTTLIEGNIELIFIVFGVTVVVGVVFFLMRALFKIAGITNP